MVGLPGFYCGEIQYGHGVNRHPFIHSSHSLLLYARPRPVERGEADPRPSNGATLVREGIASRASDDLTGREWRRKKDVEERQFCEDCAVLGVVFERVIVRGTGLITVQRRAGRPDQAMAWHLETRVEKQHLGRKLGERKNKEEEEKKKMKKKSFGWGCRGS